MGYIKTINLLDNTPNQPSKFRSKYSVEINDASCGTYNTNSKTKFKTSVLKSSLCDYSYVYVLIKGTISVTNTKPAVEPAGTNSGNGEWKILPNLMIE